MNREKLEKYGNELTISGLIIGNDLTQEVIMFPNEEFKEPIIFNPTQTEIQEIFNQLDTLEITGFQKIVLRKSQRNIEQGISWEVFRRDNFTCRYCGANNVPMTVDHVVLWEDLGDSVTKNLICACRKCNKTRGNMKYPDWLQSTYYLAKIANVSNAIAKLNIDAWEIAKAVPLRKHTRSR